VAGSRKKTPLRQTANDMKEKSSKIAASGAALLRPVYVAAPQALFRNARQARRANRAVMMETVGWPLESTAKHQSQRVPPFDKTLLDPSQRHAQKDLHRADTRIQARSR
jgi:hypothetical protein